MKEGECNFDLVIQNCSGYLHVLLHCDTMTIPIAKDYLQRIADESERLGLERVLIERDVPTALDVITIFNIASEFMRIVGRRKIAIVNPHSALAEDLDFAVTVASNRGANFKLFTNNGEAEQWLLG